MCFFFFFQAEDGIRDYKVTGVQTCALPISRVYGFCAVRSYHRSRRSAPNTRSSAARTMTEIGLFSTNLSNTAPSIGGLLEDKIEEGLSYTISSHLYTTGPLACRRGGWTHCP